MFFHFSLLFPVLFPPLCFPIVVPVVLPRCTTPLLGRSPRANRCENWWLRTCAHLQKNEVKKNCDFHFFLRFTYRHYFKAIEKIRKCIKIHTFFFHFSLLFPVLFPPLCFPIVVPVVVPRCTTPLLGRSPRANRCENWWLRTCAHLKKN